ncbi:hypothetical protein QSH18_16950 [Xanthomonas sp. NCPPB 2654]|uniref:hypothetical protein n=1 Tax=unclassified Xanthomonas TaxID=2643310 RepID=UPI0021DFDC1E|nr:MULTISPECIES: hypothetical protein [unclassified Xanthomonas]MDL5367299.1 hypothetical protein [Xanthomonas sp. NCPPB 2654]UYC19579.1 hypothetical protein NUG20_15530 [Xanthomonas sp. CFBP 8443]
MKRPPYSITEFDDTHKRELEEWLLLDHRLREVDQALKLVHSSLGRARNSRVARIGSTTSTRSNYCFAVITYMRCFSPGRYRRLRIESISDLTPTNLETHAGIRTIRNTFFAHAVADEEGEHIYLHAPIGGSINGFATISVVLLCDSKQTVRNFMNLVAKVRKFVLSRVEEVGDKIATRFFGPGASWKELSTVASRYGQRP